jgi:predicted O-methyltransferase YrrM
MSGLLKIGIQIFRDEGIIPFIQKGFRYIMQFLSIPFCHQKIKNFYPQSLSDSIEFAYERYFGLIQPAQVRKEITDLLKFLDSIKLKTVFEIGTMNGGTLFLFSRIASKDAVLISVDLPWAKFGYGYLKCKIPMYESFVMPGQKLHLLRANSHELSTLNKLKQILNGKKVDFLFLDGDHTYNGVKKDFEMYSPIVRKGGIIAFHDIAPHPPETGCDVYRFWNEVKKKHPESCREFVEDRKQGWAGIGILEI